MHKALDKLPGVASVTPNSTTKMVALKVDPAKFVLKDALAALAKVGYSKAAVVEEEG